MSLRTRNALLGFNLFLAITALLFIFVIWPESSSLNQPRTISILGIFSLGINAETTYILVVVLSAIIGSFVHVASSFAVHCSISDLSASWSVWYATRPFIGAALALALYFTVRGGLLNFGTDVTTVNIYGVAGLSGITGMFSNQATIKLRDIAETLFKTVKT